jgi:hypothetical protein
MKDPFLHVASIQKFPYQPQESFIVDSDPQNFDHHIVVDVVEKSLDVAFNEPFCSGEVLLNLNQRSVAASVWPESMRAVFKLLLENGLQDHPKHFLH